MRTIPFETFQGGAFRSVARPSRGHSGIFGSVWATLLLWQQRAVERHQMRDLPDYLLKDMGLDPVDVSLEAAKPFWRA